MNLKVEINAKPVYRLHLTASLVESIMKCCSMHYSQECKKAGAIGGFVFGWHNQFQFAATKADLEYEPMITATERELDICSKIMELPPLMPTEKIREMDRFKRLIQVAIRKGQTETSNLSWWVVDPQGT